MRWAPRRCRRRHATTVRKRWRLAGRAVDQEGKHFAGLQAKALHHGVARAQGEVCPGSRGVCYLPPAAADELQPVETRAGRGVVVRSGNRGESCNSCTPTHPTPLVQPTGRCFEAGQISHNFFCALGIGGAPHRCTRSTMGRWSNIRCSRSSDSASMVVEDIFRCWAVLTRQSGHPVGFISAWPVCGWLWVAGRGEDARYGGLSRARGSEASRRELGAGLSTVARGGEAAERTVSSESESSCVARSHRGRDWTPRSADAWGVSSREGSRPGRASSSISTAAAEFRPPRNTMGTFRRKLMRKARRSVSAARSREVVPRSRFHLAAGHTRNRSAELAPATQPK